MRPEKKNNPIFFPKQIQEKKQHYYGKLQNNLQNEILRNKKLLNNKWP